MAEVFVHVRRRGMGVAFAALLAVPLVVRCATQSDTPFDRSTRPAPRQVAAAARRARLAPPRPRELDWRFGRVPAVRLEGEVLMDGEPVAGAEVRVGVAPGSIEPAPAVTGADGRFDLGHRDPMWTELVARLGDRRGIGWTDLADHVARGRAFVTIELDPCESWVTGRLVDAARRPLAGVALHERLGGSTPVVVEAGRSDSDGDFAVCASIVRAGGGALGQVELEDDEAGDVVLEPPFTARGRVIRTDGEAVAGAIVQVTSLRPGGARVTARSDRDGAWSAEVASGCVALTASHRGQEAEAGLPGAPEPPPATCGRPGDVVEAPPIVFERCERAARGVVRIAGVPAAGLVVTVGAQRDLTDAGGRFSFPCAVGTLEVRGHDLASGLPFIDGEDTYLELDAAPSRWIHGRVTLAGQPVHGARVMIGDMEPPFSRTAARTAGDGTYSLQVAPGTIPIWASAPGGVTTAPPHRKVVVPAGSPPVRVDLAMGIPTAVQGSVHTADGTAVARVPLVLFQTPASPDPLGLTRSDPRGFFQLAPAPGTYALGVAGWQWQLAGGRDQIPLTVSERGAVDLHVIVEPFVSDESE